MALKYGKAIRLVRAARGLSQKQLAEHLGTDPSAISLLESDKRAPSSVMLKSIAQVLRVPEYLLVFLSTGHDGLRGVSEEQAKLFGGELLRLVMEEFPDDD